MLFDSVIFYFSQSYVIFSHFHLDHCGALPYMSEMVGYDGPIYMTHPTKAICPILLVSPVKSCVLDENNCGITSMKFESVQVYVPLPAQWVRGDMTPLLEGWTV